MLSILIYYYFCDWNTKEISFAFQNNSKILYIFTLGYFPGLNELLTSSLLLVVQRHLVLHRNFSRRFVQKTIGGTYVALVIESRSPTCKANDLLTVPSLWLWQNNSWKHVNALNLAVSYSALLIMHWFFYVRE